MSFKTVRGMRDFLPEDAKLMKFIEEKSRRVSRLHGYKEIITPVVEPYELLAVKTGEEIRSRMYAFKDLGNRKVALRPEFTASVARFVATKLKNEPQPFKLFCVGNLYRYDEPQQGRFREFWQSDFELMGSNRPEADAEIILLTESLMQEVGLKSCVFKIGHVGILRGIMSHENLEERDQNAVMQLMDKKQYETALKKVETTSRKSVTVLKKLIELKNLPFSEIMGKTREIINDYEKAASAAENLSKILELIAESGSRIDMTVEPCFARGLEYYTGMIFEVYVPQLNNALGGGGRYDRLIELFGGEPTPAVGVAHGIDRIMLAMQQQKVIPPMEEEKRVIIIPIQNHLLGKALEISLMLRNANIPTEVEVMGRKLSTALEDANRKQTAYAILIGEKELEENAVVVRNLKRREQRTIKIAKIPQRIR